MDGTGGGRVEVPDDYGRTHQDRPGYRANEDFDLDQYYKDKEKEKDARAAQGETTLPLYGPEIHGKFGRLIKSVRAR